MNLNKLRELLPEVGTPSYIFDLDEFAKRAALVKKYFGETIGLCFSIKANPFVLGRLPETFDKIEVCSPGELETCRALGIPDELFTPIFAVSRIAGWSAHRIEELINSNKIIRPAYKAIAKEKEYIKLSERE